MQTGSSVHLNVSEWSEHSASDCRDVPGVSRSCCHQQVQPATITHHQLSKKIVEVTFYIKNLICYYLEKVMIRTCFPYRQPILTG